MKLQQEIEIGGRGIAPALMRIAGSALKIRLVEINDVCRRIRNGDGCGFENFVIQSDGQFFLAQAGADEQSEIVDDGARLRDGFASDGIHDRRIGQFDVMDGEPATQPEVFELADVNHGRIEPCLPRSYHHIVLFALAEQNVFAEEQVVRRHGASGAGFTDVVDVHAAAFDVFAGLTF